MIKNLLITLFITVMATTAMATSIDHTDMNIPQAEVRWSDDLPGQILLIQDQLGWGYNTHVDILNESGIPYDIISSSSIADHDFSAYDKIITAGQQPDYFYENIESNRVKFEDYMFAGGCCSFITANLFGQYNELMAWPGGFTPVISDGEDDITFDDPYSCLLDGVDISSLQYWSYSSHGVHENLPAGYMSILSAPSGSCAGWFSWGAGGAFVAHMPIEWGSMMAPEFCYNFDICIGEGIVPTASESLDSIKALYR